MRMRILKANVKSGRDGADGIGDRHNEDARIARVRVKDATAVRKIDNGKIDNIARAKIDHGHRKNRRRTSPSGSFRK